MPLTKKQIDDYAKKTGAVVAPKPVVNPRIAELKAEWNPPKSDSWFEGRKFQDKPEQGYFSRVGKAYKEAGEDVIKDVTRPSEKANPKTSDYLRAGLGTLGNVARAALVPITEALRPIISPALEKVAEIPGVKGGVEGVSKWAEKNPQAARDLEDIFDIATLGVGGAAERQVKQGVKETKNVLENTLKERTVKSVAKTAEKELTTATEAITPKAKELGTKEYGELFRRGKIEAKTGRKEATYILSDAEKATATKYQKLLQGKDPVTNGGNVFNEISLKDAQVGEYLKTKQTTIWSKPRFKKYLEGKLSDITDVTIPEARLTKAKASIVDKFVERLPKDATLYDLWEARKAFDSEIDTYMKAFSGAPTLKKDIAKELRNTVQDFIAESTEEGIYKSSMKDMRELFNLADVLEAKAIAEKGKSAWKLWIRNNPVKAKLIYSATGVVGATAAYNVLKD